MLPSLLWIAVGLIAAGLTAMQAQVALLARLPYAGWPGLVAGLLVGGLVFSVFVVVVFTFRSLRSTGWMMLAIPLLVAAAGGSGIYFPAGPFADAQVAGQWRQLHPTLRLGLRLAHLVDRGWVVTRIASAPEEAQEGVDPSATAEDSLETQHYPDEEGYAWAVDLRFSEAGPVRTWLRQGVFLLMGLKMVPCGENQVHLALF